MSTIEVGVFKVLTETPFYSDKIVIGMKIYFLEAYYIFVCVKCYRMLISGDLGVIRWKPALV